MELAAWAVANLMNVHPIKKKVTPKMLLGRGFHTPEQKRKAWDESVKPKLDKKKVN